MECCTTDLKTALSKLILLGMAPVDDFSPAAAAADAATSTSAPAWTVVAQFLEAVVDTTMAGDEVAVGADGGEVDTMTGGAEIPDASPAEELSSEDATDMELEVTALLPSATDEGGAAAAAVAAAPAGLPSKSMRSPAGVD